MVPPRTGAYDLIQGGDPLTGGPRRFLHQCDPVGWGPWRAGSEGPGAGRTDTRPTRPAGHSRDSLHVPLRGSLSFVLLSTL